MKFILVSKCGEGAGLLHRIALEGNDVGLYIHEKEYETCWQGILPRVKSFDDPRAIYIFDSTGMGEIADTLRKSNRLTFGASKFHDKLENDRRFGFDVMEKCGIKIPNYVEFRKTQFNLAKDYVKSSESERLVFKPCGDLPSKLTYCACDSEDLIRYLDYIEKNYKGKLCDFIIQDFIEGKIVSSEIWLDGTKAVGPPNQTIELKKFMNDEIGPSTGCSGNVVWLEDWNNDIIENGIARFARYGVKENFIGCIDLNTIVTEDEIYGLEWTPRFGLDAMPTLMRMLEIDAGDMIHSFASGKGKLKIEDCFGGGVRLTIPPYPIEPNEIDIIQKYAPNKNIPIRIPERFIPDVYLYEVMLKDDALVHSDGTGVILVALGLGDSVTESFEVPYEVLQNVKIPDKQYRTDIPKMLSKMHEELKETTNA